MSPTVTIAIPVRDEGDHLARTLASVTAQTYPHIVEILVADGRSTDRTREVASAVPGVRVIDNPRVRQAAGMNEMLTEAKGDVIVRVDGHCELAPDYVERCVAALEESGAALVGGAMVPVGEDTMSRAVASAMTSGLGAGPARFHVGGEAAWADTVYLGAFWSDRARAAGGYAEDVGVNEDAEFAIRMSSQGGVWFDPSISSRYVPRSSLASVAKQFYWYGRSRMATVKKHPNSLSVRQLAAPMLVVGLASPARRVVAGGYLAVLALGVVRARRGGAPVAGRVPGVMATMHLAWGTGFIVGAVLPPPALSSAQGGVQPVADESAP